MSIIEKVLDKIEHEEKPQASSESKTKTESKKIGSLTKPSAPDDEGKNSRELFEIDFEKLKQVGILTPDTVNITLSEQFRRIKIPLMANAFGKEALDSPRSNLIMVTSSLQNEGKSFTSFNMAMSIAKEFNNTVLYIDADVTQRMLNRYIGVKEQAGLVEYLLEDERSLSELLIKTNVPRLTLLPSGRNYDRVTEMWASNRMQNLMQELSERYSDRLVIFDAPPLLQDSSATILAQQVGQVVIVVEAEKTPRHVVEEALNTIESAPFIGLVLNKSNQLDLSEYGYYYPA